MNDATFTIEDADGNTDELTLPAELVEVFSEEDDESDAQVVGDISLMAFTQRAHMLVAHGEEEPSKELEEIEAATMERFEERFGMTFGEATGHQH
ncbi:DUF7545 family protein [Halobacterium zhouii]|uniref:DUF7545 family protein n=1 Tax=Halobacterium zhouii TaxID=2902624 RepID=UPI001E31C480|nr:hypothetical protein [Halobacterium zhouii]